jgi:hypothetical protein
MLEVASGYYESFPARQVDCAALLRQRMSTGENCSPSRPPAVPPQRPLSAMLDPSPVKRLDDLSLRLEREQGLRQDAEQRLQRVTSLALEYITKYATAERELRSVDLTQKQQRLGTITTQVSGVPKWLGGIDDPGGVPDRDTDEGATDCGSIPPGRTANRPSGRDADAEATD